MNSLISVIIPIYKVEKYLNKCVASVVNQTHKNLEIILVDDGSPDNCPKICDELALKDTRIKVVHKKNGGLSDARNVGIETATGDYIMFLDSDDYIAKDMCEYLLSLLLINDCDFAGCGFSKVFEDQEFETDEEQPLIALFKGEDKLKPLLNPKLVQNFVMACAKLYKRAVFQSIRYPVGKLHEDEFTITEIINTVNSYVLTTKKMYFYLQRGGSITMGRGEKNAQHSLEAYQQRYLDYLKRYPKFHDQISLAFMLQLRELYLVYNNLISKQLKHKIFVEFKQVFKQVNKKSLRDYAFRYFKGAYVMYINLKNKKKR